MSDSHPLPDHANAEHIYDLASQCLSGEADARQMEDLERLLITDEVARETFFEFMQESSFLYVWATDFDEVGPEETDDQTLEANTTTSRRANSLLNRAGRRPKASAIGVALLTMAAGLLIMAMLPMARRDKRDAEQPVAKQPVLGEEVATMSGWQRVIWKRGVRHPMGYTPRLRVGERLAVDRGFVEITYDIGARVVLEGPAEYEVVGKKNGFLEIGRLTVRAEKKEAKGFIIDTPRGSVKDLGTEFGVAVSERGVEMHVLSGSVAATFASAGTNTSETRVLRKDDSLGILANGQIENKLPADVADSFVSISKRLFVQSARPTDSQKFLVDNPDLLVHYPMVPGEEPARLENRGRGGSKMDATIAGAKWTDGRSGGARALSITKPDEQVRLNVPGEFKQLTLTMWVRVESLERAFHGLILSDGWNIAGQVHWQILNDGRIELAINRAEPYVHFADFRFEPKRWYHLTLTCDVESRQARLFVDGKLVDRQATPPLSPLMLGATAIGGWASAPNVPSASRHLGGQFGELMIFTRTLNEREVRQCFLAPPQQTLSPRASSDDRKETTSPEGGDTP